MEGEKKKALSIVIVIVLVLLLGVWYFWDSLSDSAPVSNSNAPVPQAELAPALKLTEEEKTGNVSAKRAQILSAVNSGRALTSAERSEISGIMLTKAHIYTFSDEERKAIFKALQR